MNMFLFIQHTPNIYFLKRRSSEYSRGVMAGMRAQYHFRRTELGLCAWDVRRLAELTRGLPREWVPLAAIRELDELYWANERKQAITCRDVVEHARLMLECDLTYPIILSQDGRVMDGMHRVCRALLKGLSEIEAVRFMVDLKLDYVGVDDPDALPYVDD
jgi:hypothetical protein